VRIRGPEGRLYCDADHGAGPVDAVYRAINRVIGEPNELIEFSIQAVTEGIDAVGRVTIRIQAGDPVRDNGYERRVFSGRASDTDIVVASAKAYMFALNRLIAARREAEVLRSAQDDKSGGGQDDSAEVLRSAQDDSHGGRQDDKSGGGQDAKSGRGQDDSAEVLRSAQDDKPGSLEVDA
jgi:hypothetical protein